MWFIYRKFSGSIFHILDKYVYIRDFFPPLTKICDQSWNLHFTQRSDLRFSSSLMTHSLKKGCFGRLHTLHLLSNVCSVKIPVSNSTRNKKIFYRTPLVWVLGDYGKLLKYFGGPKILIIKNIFSPLCMSLMVFVKLLTCNNFLEFLQRVLRQEILLDYRVYAI